MLTRHPPVLRWLRQLDQPLLAAQAAALCQLKHDLSWAGSMDASPGLEPFVPFRPLRRLGANAPSRLAPEILNLELETCHPSPATRYRPLGLRLLWKFKSYQTAPKQTCEICENHNVSMDFGIGICTVLKCLLFVVGGVTAADQRTG